MHGAAFEMSDAVITPMVTMSTGQGSRKRVNLPGDAQPHGAPDLYWQAVEDGPETKDAITRSSRLSVKARSQPK
jgi:hypothetical protein